MIKMLIDNFGRNIDYLRVSVTDRCNLRCIYCMPPEGIEWKPHDNILTFEEIIRIIKIMAGLGIKYIKVTGGEPLLRRGTPLFIKNLKTISGIENVTLTTNGLLLGEYLDETETMGQNALPDGINISLDVLDSEQYKRLTRRENADPKMILNLIDRLLEKDITVKINCVPVRAVNEQEIIPLTSLAKEKNIIVRFIELMPIGSAVNMQPVPGMEIAAQIEKAFGPLSPFAGISGNGPAACYSLPGFKGKIGFINAVTRCFCENCNRLRLASQGLLKLCLLNNIAVDLRELLRGGANDNELAKTITEAAAKKPRNHAFLEQHNENMSKIGG
jgi:cyclic pyranopterin phosphate synthase